MGVRRAIFRQKIAKQTHCKDPLGKKTLKMSQGVMLAETIARYVLPR